jgi:hypothetical protein
MGRYYSGDIEGKFMFAVQSSDAPERFCAKIEGVDGDSIENPEDDWGVHYMIHYEDYDNVKKELDSIDSNAVQRVVKMFNENDYYGDETMKQYNVSEHDLSEYADYQLGKQILEYLEREESDCYIYAEL